MVINMMIWENHSNESIGRADDAVYVCRQEGDKFVGYKVGADSGADTRIAEANSMPLVKARVETYHMANT